MADDMLDGGQLETIILSTNGLTRIVAQMVDTLDHIKESGQARSGVITADYLAGVYTERYAPGNKVAYHKIYKLTEALLDAYQATQPEPAKNLEFWPSEPE